MDIGEELTLGLDLGIGSCGWGLIGVKGDGGAVVDAGSYCFNVPVVGGKSKNKFDSLEAAKRAQTGAMRRTRRKRAKMNALRRLLHQTGLLPSSAPVALAEAQLRVSPEGRKPQVTPFDLRADALSRLLTADEFAVVIGHFFAHPGFRSSAKRLNRPNQIREHNKVLAGVEKMKEYAGKGYRTVGEMLANDPEFRSRKRNRSGNYSRTVGRNDIEFEIKELFRLQCDFGCEFIDGEHKLRDGLLTILNRKAEPKDDYYPVGDCRFEIGEKRAAKHSYSFERFRLLDKLVKLQIVRDGPAHPTSVELRAAIENFGAVPRVTYADLRRIWGLSDHAWFGRVARKDEAEQDVASAKGHCAFGTHCLRSVLGEVVWQELSAMPEFLDRIALILSFATKFGVVETDLAALGLDAEITEQIGNAYRNGEFDAFRRAGHFSAKAARNLIPHLEAAMSYSDACDRCHYKHTAAPVATARVTNQVTRRAVAECLSLLEAIVLDHGMPKRICIELGRDVARSAEKREEIEEGIKRATIRLSKIKDAFSTEFGHKPDDFEFRRYRLAREQAYKCLYSGKDLPREAVKSGHNLIAIDHILPQSRFGIVGDYDNFIVCLVGENSNKGDRTPHEWVMATQPSKWPEFVARVGACKELRGRKRRFLLFEDAETRESGFMKRSLADSQFAARLVQSRVLEFLRTRFPDARQLPDVVARPARLVSWLRRGWELNHLKYPNGVRTSDDRHHAVDALIVAAITDRTLKRAIDCAKENEVSARPRFEFSLPQPWPTFSKDVERAINKIELVARAVNHDFGGKLHDDTTYALSGKGKTKVKVVRKGVDKLKHKDLKNIKDPDRNHRLIETLREWFDRGKPKESPPTRKYRWPDGTETREPIRKVSLVTKESPAFTPARARKGGTGDAFATFDRGKKMIRVDVFKAKGGKSAYFLVPVYPYQLAGREALPAPPDRAVVAHKEEAYWTVMDGTFQFLFSLVLHDFIEIVKSDGDIISGYFKGLDRWGGQIAIASLHDLKALRNGIGSRQLAGFRKFHVDRLGRRFEIERETRTWHGVACT